MGEKKKVVIAMSGGVDSSVAAALLVKEGFDVVGVHLKFWAEEGDGLKKRENRCCSVESERLAREVAKILEIPFKVIDLRKEFKKEVVEYFLEEFANGRTPNPCVVCNEKVKFGLLFEKLEEFGGGYLSTGHYCRIETLLRSPSFGGQAEENGKTGGNGSFDSPSTPLRQSFGKAQDEAQPRSGSLPSTRLRASRTRRCFLQKAKDRNKDQSYFLWKLRKEVLSRVLFPIGDKSKTDVRKIAKDLNLPVKDRRDSQEICFVEDSVAEFLRRHIPKAFMVGPILDIQGEEVGRHKGLPLYTIGQRRGIHTDRNIPLYVVKIDVKNNALTVGRDEECERREFEISDTNWFLDPEGLDLRVQVRYGGREGECRVTRLDSRAQNGGGKYLIQLTKTSDRAITPGQSAVFYEGDRLVGGGVIC